MKFFKLRKLTKRIIGFLLFTQICFSVNAQTDSTSYEPFRPVSVIKIDPSHMIFNYAQGIMVGYETKLTKKLNWSLELGTAIDHNKDYPNLHFKSGFKVKAGIRQYIVHEGRKRRRTQYLAVGFFYDNHTLVETGHDEYPPAGSDPESFDFETKRKSIGIELINGFILPLGKSAFIEAYGALRSSLKTRDHLLAPDIYRTGPVGSYFGGLRKEGTLWRSFHPMVGFKLSFVLK